MRDYRGKHSQSRRKKQIQLYRLVQEGIQTIRPMPTVGINGAIPDLMIQSAGPPSGMRDGIR